MGHPEVKGTAADRLLGIERSIVPEVVPEPKGDRR